MSDIYFSKSKNTLTNQALTSVVRMGSELMHRFARESTIKIAEKVLCTPLPKKQTPLLDGFEAFAIEIDGHMVQGYRRGDFDRTLLLVHGWAGGAHNFKPFFDRILAEKYNIVTFDHVAHGNSSGRYANYILFYKTVAAMIAKVQKENRLAGVIAHSMGASAVVGANDQLPKDVPVALIAPVIPLFESFYSNVDRYGISTKWVDSLIAHLEVRHDLPVKTREPKTMIKNLTQPLLIVHDKQDTYISQEENEPWLPEKLKKSVVTTEKLGHFRILKTATVIDMILKFITEKQK